jgi:hypothetical protein
MPMSQTLFRAVEVVFTAYAVPGLLVPLVWGAWRLLGPSTTPPTTLARIQRTYSALVVLWLVAWLALRIGVPLEAGGKAAGVLFWIAYALLNVVFAWQLVRFTAGYGEISDEATRDRLFVRFLCQFLLQPVTTACAFGVLYRIMGVLYHMQVPSLAAVQEGI